MFRKLCALRVTGTKFYVSGHGAKKYFGGPKFFKRRIYANFCGQNEEKINHHVTKIII